MVKKISWIGKDISRERYELGEDVTGTCPNCSGRGRKQHLEYNGDDEVICMVCSKIFKLGEIEETTNYLNNKNIKGGIENARKKL